MGRFMLLFVCSVVLLGLAQAAFQTEYEDGRRRTGGLFKAPFLPLHLAKKSLTESARKTREAEQQVQDQIQAVVNQVNTAVEKNAELNRRDAHSFAESLFPFHLVKKSLTESAKKTREAEQNVQDKIQDVISQVNAAVEKNAELNRRDAHSFGKSFFPFHLVKKSLTESAKKTREAEQNVQDKIQDVISQIKKATGSEETDSGLTRREGQWFGLW